jgi:hypothetical protein
MVCSACLGRWRAGWQSSIPESERPRRRHLAHRSPCGAARRAPEDGAPAPPARAVRARTVRRACAALLIYTRPIRQCARTRQRGLDSADSTVRTRQRGAYLDVSSAAPCSAARTTCGPIWSPAQRPGPTSSGPPHCQGRSHKLRRPGDPLTWECTGRFPASPLCSPLATDQPGMDVACGNATA